MKRILRSFLTLLMLVVWVSGFAQDTKTIDLTQQGFKNGDKVSVVNGTDIKLEFSKANGSTDPKYYDSGSSVRMYKNNTLTISSTTKKISKIKFTLDTSDTDAGAPAAKSFNIGSYDVSNNTWSGNASKVILTQNTSKKQIRIKKLEITCVEDGPAKTATTLDFGLTTKTLNIDETFTANATLKAGEATISGNVTYTSSKPEVATVNETTGEVSALAVGTTKITANFAGNDNYAASTATYDLTVVDPNAPIANIVFDKAVDAFGTLGFYNKDNTSIGEYSLKASDGNLYVFKTNGGKTAKVNGNLQLKKTSGSLESPVFDNFVNGYVVNVTFSQSGTSPLTITSGGETKKADISDGAGKNTNGIGFLLSMNIEAGNNFMLKAGNAAYISKIEIIPLSAPLTLSEADADTDSKIATNNGKTVDVTLTRTLTAGVWNTICLPFDVTAEQIANVLKSEGNVKEYGSEDASKQTIYFKDAATMVAGTPYLIKPTEGAKELVFKGVTIKNVDAVDRMVGDKYNMCGVFGKYAMNTNGTELFLKTDGKFYVPAEGKETMKGFRAYFLVPKNTAAAALNLSFGDATGINGVAADAEKNVKVYNVNGQYVGTSLEALPKGLYIVGGKKVLK